MFLVASLLSDEPKYLPRSMKTFIPRRRALARDALIPPAYKFFWLLISSFFI